MINVQRKQLLEALDARAALSSTIVLGSPGSGKSWLLDEFAREKKRRKEPVVYLYAEDYNVSSVKDLQAQLNVETDFTSALSRIAGPKPVLMIDALDALRGEASQRAFRDLVRKVQRNLPEWRIVASMRTYDALQSVELRSLFRGNSSGEFSEPGVRLSHVAVPNFSEDELMQAAMQDVRLKPVIDTCSVKLKELLCNPFNLWLLVHLLDDGIDPKSLTDLTSEVQLIDEYWAHRIGGKADSRRRELLLSELAKAMIHTNTLSVPATTIPVSELDGSLSGLLSDEILRQSITGRIGFRHNILFDFAIARLLLDEDSIFDFISADPSRDLFYRTSLSYFLARLWFRDRTLFWTTTLSFFNRGSGLRPRTSTLPGLAIFNTAQTIGELDPLFVEQEAASSFGVQSLLRSVQTFDGLQSTRRDLWLSFIIRTALRLDVKFINEFLFLLAQAFEISDASRNVRSQLAEAAVRALRWMWQTAQSSAPQSKAQLLSIAASRVLPHIIKSYYAIPDMAREVVVEVLERIGSPDASSDETSWLCRNVVPIMYAEPTLVRSIYRKIYGYRETSEESTHLGGVVFSLRSNRAQDYSLAYYSLEMAFPKFFTIAPLESTLALVDAIQGEIEREHPRRQPTERADFTFDYLGVQVVFKSDESDFWGEGFVEETSLKLLSWWLHHVVESIKSGDLSTAALEELFRTLASGNPYPIVWKRLLEYAKLESAILFPVIIPLLQISEILGAPETSVAAGDAISTLYSSNGLGPSDKMLIEQAILEVPNAKAAKAYRSPEMIMKRLLGCIPESAFALDHARELLIQARQTDDVAPNERHFKVGSFRAIAFTQEDWLREQGVKTEEPENRTALNLRAPLATFEARHVNDSPSMEEVEEIAAHLAAVQQFLLDTKTIDETMRRDLLTVAAGAAETVLKRDDLVRNSETVRLCQEILFLGADEKSEIHEGADDAFDRPMWGPTPQIESAEGLMRYIWNWGGENPEVLSKVESLSSSPSPAVRFQIATHMLAIYKTAPDKFWPFAQRMLLAEGSTGVLVALLRTIGHSYLQKNAGEKVVSLFSLRWRQGFPMPREHDSITAFVHVVAELAIVFEESTVQPLLTEILNVKLERAEVISQLAQSVALYASHGVNDVSERDDLIRARARKILVRLIMRVQSALGEMTNAKRDDQWEGIVKSLLGSIDNIIFRIYVTAGTNPQLTTDRKEQLTSVRLRTFYSEIRPVMQLVLGDDQNPLRYLGPSSAQHFMELFNQLLDFDPVGIVDLAAKLCSMNLFGYQFDQQAVSAMAKFIEKFLADQKQYLSEPEVATKVGEILDLFIDAGWPEASRLLANLDRAMA